MKISNTSHSDSNKIKIVIAGESGNGKTTLASTIEKGLGEKVLVISAEAGLLSLQSNNIDYVELQTDDDGNHVPKEKRIARLADIFKALMTPEFTNKYKWIFVDSLTEVSQNLHEQLDSMEEFQGPKNTIKKYGELANRMRSLCKSFRDMTQYNVVFSALTKDDTDQDNVKHTKISLIGSFADQLPALFDLVLYLGVTPEIDDQGRNVRKILTQKTDKILFPKDRSGKLERLEPADLSVIIKKIREKNAILPDISQMAKSAHLQHKDDQHGKKEAAVTG